MSKKTKKPIVYIIACLILASCDEINLDSLLADSEEPLTSDPQAELSFVDASNSNTLIPISNMYNDPIAEHYDQYDIGMLRVANHPQYTGATANDLGGVTCDLDYTFNIENTGIAPLKLSNISVSKTTDYSGFNLTYVDYAPEDARFSISNSPDLYLDVNESTTIVVNFKNSTCLLAGAIYPSTEYSVEFSEVFTLSFNTNDLDEEDVEIEVDLYGYWS